MTSHVPPHDLDAEGAVLSSCLIDPGLIDELRDCLSPGDFYADANRRVWDAACSLVDAGKPVDAVTVATELRERGRLEQVGGVQYLAILIDTTPSVANVVEYARTVVDLSRRRRVIATTRRIAVEGYGDVGDINEWCQRVEADVFAATNDGVEGNDSAFIGELASEQIRVMNARRDGSEDGPSDFASVRWIELSNRLSGGWRRGKLHVLAGRPGMGKTAAALGCATGASERGEGVVFLSLEMTSEELTQRTISSEAMVPLKTVITGDLSAAQWTSVAAVATDLGKWPMRMVYKPGAKIAQIRSIIRREIAYLRRERGVDTTMVVLDYIQLISGERRKGESRESEVSEISRQLTALAGELNVALLALSQLSREVERRPNKRPQLSDLRESGAIEQDAYSVSFLYRDEYYNENSDDAGLVEWIVAKNRNASVGWLKLKWDGACVRINDISSAIDGYDDVFDDY